LLAEVRTTLVFFHVAELFFSASAATWSQTKSLDAFLRWTFGTAILGHLGAIVFDAGISGLASGGASVGCFLWFDDAFSIETGVSLFTAGDAFFLLDLDLFLFRYKRGGIRSCRGLTFEHNDLHKIFLVGLSIEGD
jgi:hypothetical protein